MNAEYREIMAAPECVAIFEDKFPLIQAYCATTGQGVRITRKIDWFWMLTLKGRHFPVRDVTVEYVLQTNILTVKEHEGRRVPEAHPHYRFERREFSEAEESRAIAFLRSVLVP